jgi:hypothetical protein
LLENAQLRVVTVGKPQVSSPVALENVAVRVSFHGHSVSRRGFVRLYGTVVPAEVGALVGSQLLRPGHRSVNEGGTVVPSERQGDPCSDARSRLRPTVPACCRTVLASPFVEPAFPRERGAYITLVASLDG